MTKKKRKIVLIITDQTDIEELRKKITRDYASHIWGHYVELPMFEGLSVLPDEPTRDFAPYREDYPDGDEG